MKPKQLTIAALVLALVGLVGFSMSAYAGWGGGPGGCNGPGSANCPRGGSGPGGANLTDEEIAIVQKERNAFFESTRDLRERRYQKSLELRAEMAKQNPDAGKAAGLQKEASALESDLGAKRIEQQLKMKKEYPQIYGKAFGRGHGMDGYGGGMGPGGGMRGGMRGGMGPGGGAPCCQ
jgi:Spy/CpxP family protein refolding chaperone